MKRMILLLILPLLLVSNGSMAQSWFIQSDSSAFDGISKTCGVYGKSNDEVYTSPVFLITPKAAYPPDDHGRR